MTQSANATKSVWITLYRAAVLTGISRHRLLVAIAAGRVRSSAGQDGRICVRTDDALALGAEREPRLQTA